MNSFWKDWELLTHKGRQIWRFTKQDTVTNAYLQDAVKAFDFNKHVNPNAADLVYRNAKLEGQDIGERKSNSVEDALQQAIYFYSAIQTEDGHWTGDYGGPLFLLPGLIVASVVTDTPLPAIHQRLIAQYIFNQQNKDGGWGLHIEDKSTVFGTVMNYVALRFLGFELSDTSMQLAQTWIQQAGGATGIPSWGKFYLSLLNVYAWDGNNTLLPELWLLPKGLPVHPWRYWCHTRMVYLPMSYCYAHRIQIAESELVHAIRKEIYTTPYNQINWTKAKDEVNALDVYHKASSILNVFNAFANFYERFPIQRWRKKALDFVSTYIDAEDEQTNYINIGPVNQVVNSIAVWHKYGKESEQFQKHVERWYDYLWLAEDGLKMNGYNGSQLWDTAFAVQAFCESDMAHSFLPSIENAYSFIDDSQIKTEVRDFNTYFRHASVGGWPFSTRDHSWPITDCTAEGLLASMAVHSTFPELERKVSYERMCQAVDLILSFQNEDNGWASYELSRGPKWLEVLNPAAVFADIMIDYSYVECSSSCIQALHVFHQHYPEYKTNQVKNAIETGLRFLLSKQREDGSWIGSWAVCFTYGTWFALESLTKQGYTYASSKSVKGACDFLVAKVKEDGGWGESFESCVRKEYIQHGTSQCVNTAWALLSLMAADYPNKQLIDKGIQLLIQRQVRNGDWPQEAISGVFNFNCMITYTSYRNVFPIWALARYMRKYN